MSNKFFSDNATAGEYPVADDGLYICRLKEVEKTQAPDFNDSSIQVDKLRWVFSSLEETDDKGNPYRFSRKTGTNYGGSRAGLTILVDSMMGRHLTPDEFRDLDLDELKAQKWKVMVQALKGDDGKPYNAIASVKPMKSAGSAVIQRRPTSPVVPKDDEIDNSDLEDPFGPDNA